MLSCIELIEFKELEHLHGDKLCVVRKEKDSVVTTDSEVKAAN